MGRSNRVGPAGSTIFSPALVMPLLDIVFSAAVITLSSVLLFVVQPIVARELLPVFGGSPMVWATTMLFFQVVLLVGYAYAHWLAVSARRATRFLHLGLLVLALTFVPLSLVLPEQDRIASSPSLQLLTVLVAGLFVPAALLSSTNPLVQSWLAFDALDQGASSRGVYRWFALSNLGSLGGLLSYPFVIEPRLTLPEQRWWWSAGFVCFVLLSGWLSWRQWNIPGRPRTVERRASGADSRRPFWLWCLLAASGSWLYLATTNQLTRNVAPVPFLWVVPLSLYLLSFILCFERDGWYRRGFWVPVAAASTGASCYLLRQTIDSDYVLQLLVYLTALFAGAMVCHGELARLRPDGRLTQFYLSVAFGGAVGGVGVSLVAPAVFKDYWEFPMAFLWLVLGFALAVRAQTPVTERDSAEWQTRRHTLIVLVALMVGFVAFHIYSQTTRTSLVRRNFFGVLRVYDGFVGTDAWRRDLWNGGIGHGGQFISRPRRLEPTMYFGPDSGIGLTLAHLGAPEEGRRAAILGLGVGTLAAYGRPMDEFVFYELNPDVADVARSSFYYLSETAARTEVRIGDGRQTLAREHLSGERDIYDLIVMDAFTGDAIPVHLITREAFALYDAMLKPGGVIAVNISNIHFDLRPVLRAQAEALDAVALFFSDEGGGEHLLPSDWVVISQNAEFIAQSGILSRSTPWTSLDEQGAVSDPQDLDAYLWTDDFSNVFSVLRERD